ncbi:MAG: hypothetical protein KGJ41_18830 [Rhodospirillales bacterium]|nr:hypothetical protein [Rhodospirillales bacterium]MDE2201065.1 hypothetical protein [Rhodospirillales bacterium]
MTGLRSTRRALLPLGAGLLLSGCGFRPIYAAHGDGTMGPAEAGLAATAVAIIPERSGQLLRQALQARLHRDGAVVARRYDLNVTMTLAGDPIGIQPDNSASRVRLMGVANWSLTARNAQRSTLTAGTAKAIDGYNVLDQQFFAADMESEVVIRRIAEALADQTALQLAVYFNRQHAKGEKS